MRLFSDVPGRVLAIFAHPDDAEIAAGGTLASWASQGTEVRLVLCTLGDKGSRADDSPEAVALRRSHEASNAAARLGVGSLVTLGYPDGEVTNESSIRRRIVGQIREFEPEVVICPDPTTVYFAGGYYNHRDHREVGWAALDSAFPAARLPKYFPEEGRPHSVGLCLLSGTLFPDVLVDISGGLRAKIEAVAEHSSQLEYGVEWLGTALSRRAEDVAKGSGLKYGECFRLIQGGG